MSRVFYTADTHFNHAFVAGLRGYSDQIAHDDDLIARFNSCVTKRDHLWILGDLGMGSLGLVLMQARRLNGIKHLVLGNHDPGHPMHRGSSAKLRRYLEVFESVHLAEQHILDGIPVLLSHYPYRDDHTEIVRDRQWRLRDEGGWLLHGHVHAEFKSAERQLNVGVDWARTPWTGAEVVEHIRGLRP